MENLKYKVIKTDAQYYKYCDILEAILESGKTSKAIEDEIELLTLLIETYDEKQHTLNELDPVELLKGLMKEHKIKAVNLSELLGVSEGLVSDILHYKKGFSKETIRILSEHFKLNQQAFNRSYELKGVKPKKSTIKPLNQRVKKLAKAS